MNQTLSLTIAPGIIWRALDGNAVLLSPLSGDVRVLNGMGTMVWKQLAEGRSLGEIRADLLACYDASVEEIESDLDDFLRALLADGMLRVERSGASETPLAVGRDNRL